MKAAPSPSIEDQPALPDHEVIGSNQTEQTTTDQPDAVAEILKLSAGTQWSPELTARAEALLSEALTTEQEVELKALREEKKELETKLQQRQQSLDGLYVERTEREVGTDISLCNQHRFKVCIIVVCLATLFKSLNSFIIILSFLLSASTPHF